MKNRKIVLGVCGSIAIVKTVELIRELRRQGFEVECVMSKDAQRLLQPDALLWASGNEVITELDGNVNYIKSCSAEGDTDLLLICPATANTISKIACAIGDTPVTTYALIALGSGIPVLIAPAMHLDMYYNPILKENIEKLKKLGVKFVEPKIEENKAKFPGKREIVESVKEILKSF